jgi:hypothetical protein
METDTLRARAKVAYERARLRAAIVRTFPLVLIVAIAHAIDPYSNYVWVAGALMIGSSIATMHTAQRFGHLCAGPTCFSVCVPAAFLAALISGLWMGRRTGRARAPITAWASAAWMSSLTGALACACLGIGGIAGVFLGLTIGSAPFVWNGVRAPQ